MEPPPCPATEMLRFSKVKKLRRHLLLAVRRAGLSKTPLLVFERWQARMRLLEDGAAAGGTGTGTGTGTGPRRDPLLPSGETEDRALVRDLVRGGLDKADARAVAAALGLAAQAANKALCQSTAAQAQGSGEGSGAAVRGVHVGRSGRTRRLCYGADQQAKPYFVVNEPRFQWLLEHYRTTGVEGGSEAGASASGASEAVFCLLARYEALGGHGYQCALPEAALDELAGRLGVTTECFASPLNCRLSRFYSAFPDVDSCFGSLGSFFHAYPTAGSFEVNPPFIPEVMSAAVLHITSLLDAGRNPGALSFVVVIPAWADGLAFRLLSESASLCAQFAIKAADHIYCNGAQHQSGPRYRPSSYHTAVFVLQNPAGSAKWPITDKVWKAVAAAMGRQAPGHAPAAGSIRQWESKMKHKVGPQPGGRKRKSHHRHHDKSDGSGREASSSGQARPSKARRKTASSKRRRAAETPRQ